MNPDPSGAKALFLAATAPAQAQERAAFLDRECGDDLALRARVEGLLASQDEAGTPAPLPPTAPSPAMEEQFARLKPEEAGERIGPYKLLQQIGEGGFGVVWMAEQEEPVRRRVALKIIKMGMDTKEVIARFEQERQALAMMDHPNIAKVFDAGATPFGRPFFVMELVRGIRITEYRDQASLPTADRLGLFIAVCQAVQHAHQKGIIHRDLKPSNIMVTLHDGVPVPKVIDFGVAKATQGRLTEKTLFTQFEQMIGTPLYMSPEQAELSGLDIDTRTDIYALGVVLYELLTGRTPVDRATLERVGLDEIRRIIREQEPPRPSVALQTMAGDALITTAQRRGAEPPGLIRAISGDLDWIVMKAIEKDRTRRYETPTAFANDIGRFLRDETVSAMPPSTAYQFRKFARRHKAAIRAVAGVTGLLIGATVVSTWQAVRATRAQALATTWAKAEQAQRQRAEAAEGKALSQARAEVAARKEAEAATDFLASVFTSAKPLPGKRAIPVVDMLAAAAQKLETDFDEQPSLRAKLQGIVARTYHVWGADRQAIPLQDQARLYYAKTLGLEHRDTLQAMHNLAISYFDYGRHHPELRLRALALRAEVFPLSQKVNGAEHPDTLQAMAHLAISYTDAGRLDDALARQLELLPLSQKVNGPEDPATLSAMNGLANSLAAAGRRDEALRLRAELLPLTRRVSGLEHRDTREAMTNLASSYAVAGRHDEALALGEQALALSRKINGREDSATLQAMNLLAKSYTDAGRIYGAINLHQQVLEIRRLARPVGHRDILEAMTNLAISYRNAGQLQEVIELLEKSVEIHRRGLPKTLPSLAEAIYNLTPCYEAAGQSEKAGTRRKELAELQAKAPSPAGAK